jgi:2-polyprenyl-6-methoxyphenol hydroxylase-like FAD-dependent oxidoreductase
MRTALIVGAGIGGLSTGIALRRAGWAIRIFERAASPRELGFGLLVAPNAIAALRELGVADVVLARGFAPTGGEVRRIDGAILKRAQFPPPEVLGGPTVVALRPALHGALLDAVGAEAITLGSEATGFTEKGDRVALQLADGTVAEGDLLVGADGAGSVVRRMLHPSEPPPRSSGIIAVRGAVHGAVHHLGDLSGIYYLGPGIEAFLVRASDTGIYWALSLARELVPPGMWDPAAIQAHMSPRMDATFRAVTSGTDDLRCDELVDRDPIPFWGRGVVTLLGDAAHPVLPHTGQGAAQAIVDAVTLGRLLTGNVDVERALRAYEQERRAKTTTLLAQGRRTARLMRSTNPITCAVRDVAVRLMPVKTLFKLLARINRRAGTDVRR